MEGGGGEEGRQPNHLLGLVNNFVCSFPNVPTNI